MKRVSAHRLRFLISESTIAGGLLLRIDALSSEPRSLRSSPWGPDAAQGDELSAWIEISADDTVMIRAPTLRTGSGAMSEVAMNVTEELACDSSRVKVELCSIKRDHSETSADCANVPPFLSEEATGRERMQQVLQLGASARERLKAAAAKRLKVPVAEITAKNGVLTHTRSGRWLRYGAVAADAANISLPSEPAVKP